jgi:hypothetical protein
MIVLLGWGSLVWNPRDIGRILDGEWQADGPLLPIEYCRQSQDGRLTLVVHDAALPVQVLWSRARTKDIDEAIRLLAARERCSIQRINSLMRDSTSVDPFGLREWVHKVGVDALIWTGLPPRFGERNLTAPTLPQAIDYLRSLEGVPREKAEEYVRRTPAQIRTKYRIAIEEQLAWYPLSNQSRSHS